MDRRPSCVVYIIGPAADAAPVKVGIASSARRRLQTLQTGSPVQLFIHHEIQMGAGINVRWIEGKAHAAMWAHRRHGEWFDVTPAEAIAIIERLCAQADRHDSDEEMGKVIQLHPLAKP